MHLRPCLSRSRCEIVVHSAGGASNRTRTRSRPRALKRFPRLGRSGSTELAEVLAQPRPLSHSGNSASFRLVVCLMSVLDALNRPEVTFVDLLFPWIFMICLLGFLGAWLAIALMEHLGLSRYVWHLPLFFIALVVLFSSIIGFFCFP